MTGLFVKLDANWPDDESVIEVGLEGAGLHAHIMCVAKRTNTDGWVGRRTLARYGATDKLLDRLATCEPAPLIERREDGAVRPAGWLKSNPSKASLDAQRASKSEAGRRGNHGKHKHPGEYEECPLCHPNGLVVAGSDRTSSQALAGTDRTLSPDTETETETGVRSQGDPAGTVARIAGQVRDEPEVTADSRRAARLALVGGLEAGTPASETGAVESPDNEQGMAQ